MNSKYLLCASMLAFIGIGTAIQVSGQTQQEKWNRLSLLPANTRVVVELDGRKPAKGRVIHVTDQSLKLKANGRELDLPQEAISAVYYGKRSSKFKRGLIGALAGAGAGILIGGLAAAGGADPLIAAGGFLYGLPAGAVIGVATSGGMKKGGLIYSR